MKYINRETVTPVTHPWVSPSELVQGLPCPLFLFCLISSGGKQDVLASNSLLKNKTEQNFGDVLERVGLLWERAGKVLERIQLQIYDLQGYKCMENV